MMTGHLSVSGEVFFMYNVICQLAVWAELMLAHRKLRFFGEHKARPTDMAILPSQLRSRQTETAMRILFRFQSGG